MIQPKGPKWPPLSVAKLALRDGRYCLHCGTTEALTVQHRGVKGSGGRNSADRPSNGVILCWALNVALEQDAGLAAWAEGLGWKISSHADPTQLPVTDATTGLVWLFDDQYGRSPAAETTHRGEQTTRYGARQDQAATPFV